MFKGEEEKEVNSQEFDKLVEEFEADGFIHYVNHLDVETVQEIGCECGSMNVYAMGFAKGRRSGDNYHAFCVCRDCGLVSEF